MAVGDTSVSIVNKALNHLGAEGITSFSDGTAAAAACSSIYPEVKASTLAMYRWSFTKYRVQLVKDSATPNNEWTNQFVLPSDMLTFVPSSVMVSSEPGAGLFKQYEIGRAANGSAVLLTDAAEIHIEYQQNVTEAQMPSYFVQLLSYQLAWHLAEIITDQTGKMQIWRAEALGTPSEGGRGGYFRQAVNIDSAGQPPQVIADYLLTDVRG